MSLYALILFFSILVPLVLSFEKKVRFFKHWKYLFPAIFIVAALFISVDAFFTKLGIWGFNSQYHSSLKLLGLPIEEWLFFIIIPYASIFIQEVLIACYPKFSLNTRFSNYISIVLIIVLVVALVKHNTRYYTVYIFINAIVCLLFSLFDKARLINRFYTSFLIILIPFFIVNGILTGTGINGEVVWYNSEHILNIRLLTIPIEDVAYAFCMLYPAIVISYYLKKMFNKSGS